MWVCERVVCGCVSVFRCECACWGMMKWWDGMNVEGGEVLTVQGAMLAGYPLGVWCCVIVMQVHGGGELAQLVRAWGM